MLPDGVERGGGEPKADPDDVVREGEMKADPHDGAREGEMKSEGGGSARPIVAGLASAGAAKRRVT